MWFAKKFVACVLKVTKKMTSFYKAVIFLTLSTLLLDTMKCGKREFLASEETHLKLTHTQKKHITCNSYTHTHTLSLWWNKWLWTHPNTLSLTHTLTLLRKKTSDFEHRQTDKNTHTFVSFSYPSLSNTYLPNFFETKITLNKLWDLLSCVVVIAIHTREIWFSKTKADFALCIVPLKCAYFIGLSNALKSWPKWMRVITIQVKN